MEAQAPQHLSNDKKAIIGLLLVVVALGTYLFATTRDDSPAPAAVTTTVAIEAPAEDTTNKYEDYVAYVRDNAGRANSIDAAQLIEFGDLVCGSLDNGYSIGAVVDVISRSSSSYADVSLGAALIYGAVTKLCPEYDPILQAYLNDDTN